MNTFFLDVHSIAVLQGHESYDNLKNGFSPVFREVQEVMDTGSIDVLGKTISLEFFLGADYKVRNNKYI